MLKNKTILITGGTGFIGKALINELLLSNANIICYSRSIDKVKQLFGNKVHAVNDFNIDKKIDYIIHAACPTESKILNNSPVNVLDTIIDLTKQTLNLAKINNSRYIYLSSMEVYNNLNGYVTEDNINAFNLHTPRNSYPIGKQIAEFYVNAYHHEFNLNTCILRLSNIFGKGLLYNDNKFFNYIIKQCVENKDIILKSTGNKIHNSCYLSDAIYFIKNITINPLIVDTINITNELYTASINDICKKIINIFNLNTKIIHVLDTSGIYPKDSQCKISGNKLLSYFPNYHQTDFTIAIKELYDYLVSIQPN